MYSVRVPAMDVGHLTELLTVSAEGPLPPGRMVTSDEGDGDVQPLWLGDGPAAMSAAAEHVVLARFP